ncbi:hypothetical protein [Rathayibacter rathayi]|nr:hypothetical protein [Rathayibacter rathayi]
MSSHDANLWFEEVEQADAPMDAGGWVSNIALFGFALIALAT